MPTFHVQLTKTIVVEVIARNADEAADHAVTTFDDDADGSWHKAEAQAVVLDPETSQEMKR